MPDPIERQESPDGAHGDPQSVSDGRRLNLACRLILSVAGPALLYSCFTALSAKKLMEVQTARSVAATQGRILEVDWSWVYWTTPLSIFLSTLWLLFLWRKPIQPRTAFVASTPESE